MVGGLLIGVALLSAARVTTDSEGAGSSNGDHGEITLEKGAFFLGAGEAREPLADVSVYCIGCHDDPGISGGRDRAEEYHLGDPGRSHPVDIVYPSQGSDLVPRNALDERLVLTAGEMTCLTCHDHRSGGQGFAISPDGGELCTTCHVK